VKKALRGVATMWCALCGLAVPPALAAVVLARSMGVLDFDPLIERLERGADEGEAEADETAVVVPASFDAVPIEALEWSRRLELLDAEAARADRELAERRREIEAREASIRTVSASLAELLSRVFDAPVTPESITEEPARWRDRLASRRSAEALRPRLLKMLQGVEAEQIAQILSQPDASNGLDEGTVARLMEELPPARAGEVLTELGRKDPALAARIIARLEHNSGSPPSPGGASP